MPAFLSIMSSINHILFKWRYLYFVAEASRNLWAYKFMFKVYYKSFNYFYPSLSYVVIFLLKYPLYFCSFEPVTLQDEFFFRHPQTTHFEFLFLETNRFTVSIIVALVLVFALAISYYKQKKIYSTLISLCLPLAFSLYIQSRFIQAQNHMPGLLLRCIRLFDKFEISEPEQLAIFFFKGLIVILTLFALHSYNFSLISFVVGFILFSFDALIAFDIYCMGLNYLYCSLDILLPLIDSNFYLLVFLFIPFLSFYIMFSALKSIPRLLQYLLKYLSELTDEDVS